MEHNTRDCPACQANAGPSLAELERKVNDLLDQLRQREAAERSWDGLTDAEAAADDATWD